MDFCLDLGLVSGRPARPQSKVTDDSKLEPTLCFCSRGAGRGGLRQGPIATPVFIAWRGNEIVRVLLDDLQGTAAWLEASAPPLTPRIQLRTNSRPSVRGSLGHWYRRQEFSLDSSDSGCDAAENLAFSQNGCKYHDHCHHRRHHQPDN